MAMRKISVMWTYDTAEEIAGYNPMRVEAGQIVRIPEGDAVGRWMVVSPFNPQPWVTAPPAVPLPEGFGAIFGPKPNPNNFHGAGYPRNYQQALVSWESNLKNFIVVGAPVGSDEAKLSAARNEAIFYGLGEPRYYENIHGQQVRFPESQAGSFQANADNWINHGAGQIIVMYQDKLTNAGIVIEDPPGMHPLAPPALTTKQVSLRNAAAAAEEG